MQQACVAGGQAYIELRPALARHVGKVHKAAAQDAAATWRGAAELRQAQARSVELPAQRHIRNIGSGRRALNLQTIARERPAHLRIAQSAPHFRRHIHAARHIEHVDSGQPPQRLRRALIPQLCQQIARVKPRRQPTISVCSGLWQIGNARIQPPAGIVPVADHRAGLQQSGRKIGHQRQIERTRGEQQARPAEVVHHQPRIAHRHAVFVRRQIHHAGNRAAQAQIPGCNIGHRQRHPYQREAALHRLIPPETAIGDHKAPAIGDLRALQLPTAVIGARDDRAAWHGDGAPGMRSAQHQRDLLGGGSAVELQFETAAALPGYRGIECPRSVAQRRIGRHPAQEQLAVIDANRRNLPFNGNPFAAAFSGNEATKGNVPLGNLQRLIAAKAGIARGGDDVETLPFRPWREADAPFHPAARHCQPAIHAAFGQLQLAGKARFGHIEPVDGDPHRLLRRGEQEQVAIKRAEQRLPPRQNGKAIAFGCQCHAHIAQPRRRQRIGQHKFGARAIIGQRCLDGERPVIHMPA